jgi:hypothetical protein
MKRVVLILTLLLLAGWSLSANRVLLKDGIQVDTVNSDMVLTWEAMVEEGVDRYLIMRRASSIQSDFREIGTVGAKGSDLQYRFVDRELYKASSEQVEYELWAMFASGERAMLTQVSMNYTPTAVRRTWGSIKAMFQ